MTEEIKWLISWFSKKNDAPEDTIRADVDLNYFDIGLIDSLGVVELIADIEGHFKIRFNERHFQERRFSNISGLAEIINELSFNQN